MTRLKLLVLLPSPLILVGLASAKTFSIDNTAPNHWPAMVSFTAPCGVQINKPDDPFYWYPPAVVDQAEPNSVSPAVLCATTMRTLTDPDSVQVTSIGALNAKYTNLPDGSPLPNTTALVGGGTISPQDPQNAPTPIVEVSASGTMNFLIPVSFRDQTDTKFDGKTDGVLEVPYDSHICVNLLGTPLDPLTGLPMSSSLQPSSCIITTPTQYLDTLKQGHAIKWAEVSSGASLTAYGPMDSSAPNNMQVWKQTPGGSVTGTLNIPYQTDNNSTVLRIGVRYAIGYSGQIPLAWGGWPTPPCTELNCLAPVNWAGMQTAWIYSQPFTLTIIPAALIQFHYLPTMILYQPPGNQSTASIVTNTTYTQSYQVDQTATITDQLEYDRKTKSDVSFSETAGGSASAGLGGTGTPYSDSATWDNLTRTATGENYAQSVSSVVTQGWTRSYQTPKLGSSAPDVPHLTFQSEPFWSDVIYIAMHPQFAVWDYPEGVRLQPLGSSGLLKLSVQTLAKCLPPPLTPVSQAGLPVTLNVLNPDNSTTKEDDRLSWVECARLLALDPFYVGLSQAAPPPMGIPLTTAAESLAPQSATYASSMVTAFSTKSVFNKTIKATITASTQNTLTQSVEDSISYLGLLGIKVAAAGAETTANSTSDEFDVILGSTQSSQTQQSYSASITLADCPFTPSATGGSSNCNLPAGNNLPAFEVFEDTRFGTLMAVLPDLNIPRPAATSSPAVTLTSNLVATGLSPTHLLLPAPKIVPGPAMVESGTAKVNHTLPRPPSLGVRQPAAPLPALPGYASPLPPAWKGKVFVAPGN